MQIKKIIYFLEEYFNQRDYHRFGIDTMMSNGFDVEVWEFTRLIAPKEYISSNPPDPIQWDRHRCFDALETVGEAIKTIDNSTFVISMVHYTLYSLPLFRMLSKQGIPFSASLFALPVSSGIKELWLRRLKKITLKRIFDKTFRMIPFTYCGVKPARIVFSPAEKYMLANYYVINSQSEFLWVHSYDYDTYLGLKDLPQAKDPSVGIFLDEYLPFHTDYLYLDLPVKISADEYYPALVRFFDYIEESFNVRIVIAAHPRSHYEEHTDYFGGREVVRGKTAELVQNAGFILLHNSTAINHVVLFKKPMIFFTTDNVNASIVEDPTIEWLASFFGKKAHNLDRKVSIDFDEEMLIDEGIYRRYRNYYIKKDGTEELPYWQIVANRLKKGL
ncbi:MAG: hypothetical protein NT178_02425 [Proteobacteria bacterium]|nr:hypothetical protein [Pseudomonadota bacterium]